MERDLPNIEIDIDDKEKKKSSDIRPGKAKAAKQAQDLTQMIDGKELTENEVLFQKHLERNFDESHWLKKAGIRFLN